MSIDDLIPAERPTVEDGLPDPTGWAGEILDNAGGPSDLVRVKVPGLDYGRHEYGPCRFMPRGEDLPAAGDPCVVGFADDDEPYIQLWWPA